MSTPPAGPDEATSTSAVDDPDAIAQAVVAQAVRDELVAHVPPGFVESTSEAPDDPGEEPARTRPRLAILTGDYAFGDARAAEVAAAGVDAGYDVVVIGRGYVGVDTPIVRGGAAYRQVVVSMDRGRARRDTLTWWSNPLAFRSKAQLKRAQLTESGHVVEQKALVSYLKYRRGNANGLGKAFADVRLKTRLARGLARQSVFKARAAAYTRGVERATQPSRVEDYSASVWRALAPRSMWRRFAPEYLDYEIALGPVVDQVAPDIVHAVGPRAVGVAVRAAWRARAAGRSMAVVYDAVESAQLPHVDAPAILAADAHLHEFVRHVDQVLAPTATIAKALQQRHRAPGEPVVAPFAGHRTAGPVPEQRDVRRAARVPDGVPLIVTPWLGDAAERYLPLLAAVQGCPEYHVAILAWERSTAQLDRVRAFARQRGLEDRLHLVRRPQAISLARFATTADVAYLPRPSDQGDTEPVELHELVAAGLPVVADTKTPSARVLRQLGIGTAASAASGELEGALTGAIGGRVAAADATLRERLMAQRSQEQVAAQLRASWARVDSSGLPLAEPPESEPRQPWLLIGRSNSAGQAGSWARSVQRHRSDVKAFSLAVDTGSTFAFPSDVRVTFETFASRVWQVNALESALRNVSHVLVESLHTVFPGFARNMEQNLRLLERSGFTVGLVFHGTDVRDPELHAELHPNSPFPRIALEDPEYVERLTINARARREVAEWFGGAVFVSTPDLLDYVPAATWLPVSVEVDRFHTERPVLENRRPVVLHAPSSAILKGSLVIDEVLLKLHESGVIEYRRVREVPASEMPGLIASADIVVDQLNLGLYGVLAAEAMAAGRLVLSEVGDRIRSRVPDEIPIVEVDAHSLEDRLRAVVADPGAFVATANAGPDFVRKYHDGRRAADVLAAWTTGSATGKASG